MPQTPFTIKKLTCALLAACAAAVIVAGSAGFARAEDDEEDVPYDTKILRGIMSGIGLQRDGGGPGIDYRERSPLVVPPSMNLPPPETTASTPNAANWPVDPDEKRRKEAIAARKKAASGTRYQVEDEGRVMSQKDLTPGASASNRRAAPEGRNDGKKTEAGDRMSVFDLGSKSLFGWDMFGSKDKGEVAKFEGEPPRLSLTEPPAGYRTPSPAQPYGITADRKQGPKAMDIYDRQTPIEDRKK